MSSDIIFSYIGSQSTETFSRVNSSEIHDDCVLCGLPEHMFLSVTFAQGNFLLDCVSGDHLSKETKLA